MDAQAMEMKLDSTMDRLKRLTHDNAPYGARVNAEQEYAIAYDNLVRAGLRRPLRIKYRVR